MKAKTPLGLLAIAWALASCLAAPPTAADLNLSEPSPTPLSEATPLPIRSPHPPGGLQDYSIQTGDTLPAIAAHFNTTVEEILAANPAIPADVSTLPPGYPMRIPAYYLPLSGPTFHILPDSEFANGPSAIGFDIQSEILSRPGFLSAISDYAYRRERPAWETVEVVAENYSIHPRLLLALLEYRTQALSRPFPEGDHRVYPLGVEDPRYRGLFRQLLWAAERLNDGYYGWRDGSLTEFETSDGFLVRPDPWQNAGTVALQYTFAGMSTEADFQVSASPEGFFQAYRGLWGDPFDYEIELIPGNLQQPPLALPFQPNRIWDFTGGPHYSWGTSLPLGALDFGPPSEEGGCTPSSEWVTAPAGGVVARSGEAAVVLDLDGDGDERTGWVLFFFHIASNDMIAPGAAVQAGDPLGHPSCQGGRSTGTHVHVARRFNGEWIPAAGPLPFTIDGWVVEFGDAPYQGTLHKGSKVVPACTCSARENRIIYELEE